MNGHEKSDPAPGPGAGAGAVAMKLANEAGQPAKESVERRAGAEGNADRRSTHRAQIRARVTQALDRVRQVARQRKKERFTALLHHVNPDTLRTAFYALKRKAAPGADGVTWEDYEADLEPRLEDLHGRIHRGAYRPQPSRRTYIPKADGRQRPPRVKPVGRRLTDALVVGIADRKVNYILDADIRSFFDTVSQEWLIRFVEHRVGDKRIVRLIQKWLRAGILEDGTVTVSDRGTGQGSVISPLLANIYLHYVLDLWVERWRRREATGDMIIVRGACPRAAQSADPGADDLVAGFEHEADARRFLDEMRARFAEFSLSLHPDKTRLIEFGRHATANREQRGLGKPETFDFLGFTFISGKSRNGKFLIHRKSRRDRVRAKLKEIKEELRRRMHGPVREQAEWLKQVVAGFFQYHAVPTNGRALAAFRYHVIDLWRCTLRRRGQKHRMTWARIGKLADDWLPKPRILHPWPNQRFAVKHPRWEPYAGKPHVRFCAGCALKSALNSVV